MVLFVEKIKRLPKQKPSGDFTDYRE